MTDIIQDYLHAVRHQLTPLGLRERETVLEEIEDHLDSEAKRLRKEDRSLSRDEAALQATHAFGDPSEIGVAYGAGGGVVNQTTGEKLLDVAILSTRAVGRGVKTTLKWAGISMAVLLGFVLLVILIDAFDGDEGIIDAGTSHETGDWHYEHRILVDHHAIYDNEVSIYSTTFEIYAETEENWLRIQLVESGQVGCADVIITGPSDENIYDNTGSCPRILNENWSFEEPGTYEVQVRFLAFSGVLDIDGWANDRVEDP